MFSSCASLICFCLLVFSCFEVLNVLLFSLKISLSVKKFSIFGLNFRTFTLFEHGSSEFDLQTHKFLIETGCFFIRFFRFITYICKCNSNIHANQRESKLSDSFVQKMCQTFCKTIFVSFCFDRTFCLFSFQWNKVMK